MSLITVNFNYPYFVILGENDSVFNNALQTYFINENYTQEQITNFIQNNIVSALKQSINSVNSQFPVSGVPVYNTNDSTEIAVKNALFQNQVYNSLSDIFKLIGLENLGVKSISGGKQKQRAESALKQYVDLQSVPGSSRKRKVFIYDVPSIIERPDNRGKSGFYIDRSVPIGLDLFSKTRNKKIQTSVPKLSRAMGIVSPFYKTIEQKDLAEINEKYTVYMVESLYAESNKRLQKIVYPMLTTLQNTYKVITWFDRIWFAKEAIIDAETGDIIAPKQYYMADDDEREFVINTERDVLDEFECDDMWDIYVRKLKNLFYRRVLEIVNEELDSDWDYYYSQIEIRVGSRSKLKKALEDYLQKQDTKKSVSVMKRELRQHLADSLLTGIERKYLNTNQKATRAMIAKQIEKHPERESDLMDILDLQESTQMWSVDQFSRKIDPNNTVFYYHDNFVSIQKGLITKLIEKPSDHNETAEKETVPF